MSFLKESYFKVSKFFVSGNSRSLLAKKHILYSFGLKGISIVIGLLYVPLLLDYLDTERYGIWLTLTSIIGWFGFFDIGLGNGLRNKFAEAIAHDEHELARVYVSTAYAIITVIFTIVLMLFYFINPFLSWNSILNTSTVANGELSLLAYIVFTFFFLKFIFKLIGIISMADQRPALNNAFGPIGNIIVLTIIYVLIKTNARSSLLLLGSLLSIVPVIILIIATVILFKGKYKRYCPAFKFINLAYSKELIGLGLKFFVIQIAGLIIFTTSNIIIIQVLGPEDVTIYNIAFKYFNIPIMIYAIIMMPIWSAVTNAFAKKDFGWLKKTLKKLNLLSVVFVLGILTMLVFSNFIYRLWVGDRVEIPFILSVSMSLFACINVVLSPYSQYINGLGKLKLGVYLVIFNAGVFIPIAVFATKSYLGVSGVMFTICIINVISLIISPIQVNKILNKKAYGIWGK